MNEKTKCVKALMNNRGLGLPEAVKEYNKMTEEEREQEIEEARRNGLQLY